MKWSWLKVLALGWLGTCSGILIGYQCGVPDRNACFATNDPTTQYLSAYFPDTNFTTAPLLTDADMINAVSNRSLDLIVGSPTALNCLALGPGLAGLIATRISKAPSGQALPGVAGTIVARNDSGIATLADIRGHTVGTGPLSQLGAMQAQWGVLEAAGLPLFTTASQVAVFGSAGDVVSAVGNGTVDVGFVRVYSPPVDVASLGLRVVAPLNNTNFSTPFFPSTLLAAVKGHSPTGPALAFVSALAYALINMSSTDPAALAGGYYGWTTPQPLVPIALLQRQIGIIAPTAGGLSYMCRGLNSLRDSILCPSGTVSDGGACRLPCPDGAVCVCNPCRQVRPPHIGALSRSAFGAVLGLAVCLALVVAGGILAYVRLARKRGIYEVEADLVEVARSLLGPTVQIQERVGRGGYGTVYRGFWNGAEVAIKVSNQATKRADRSVAEAVLTTTLNHPNVVATLTHATRVLNSADSGRKGSSDSQARRSSIGQRDAGEPMIETWMVMPFCDKGDLHSQVRRLNWTEKLLTARDIAVGMQYLHGRNIVHGDLTSNNVLFVSSRADSRRMTACVADFGISRVMATPSVNTQTYGTITHVAPEVVLEGRVGTESDVYSFGILMWELYSGERPYGDTEQMHIIYKVTSLGHRPLFLAPVGQDVSLCGLQAYAALAQSCWEAQPDIRPGWEYIIGVLDGLIKDDGEESLTSSARAGRVRHGSSNRTRPA